MSEPLVLCYHALSPTWEATLSTTPERFDAQLALLRRRGYEGATFSDALESRRSGKVAVITFDDAYRSVLELAKPILDAHGYPATVFVPTAFIGSEGAMAWPGIDNWLGTPDEPELQPMSWDELRGLADAGWEIGSHTRTHPHLTSLGSQELADELAGSRQDCEEALGQPCRSLAYPYGDHNEHVVRAAGAAGYDFAGTLPARLHDAKALRWPRVGIYHGDTEPRFRLKVSPALRRLRSTRAWPRPG